MAGKCRTGQQGGVEGDLEYGGSEGATVGITREQFNYCSHTHITIDGGPGVAAGFSIGGPTGNRFIIRSRIFTEEETAELRPYAAP